MFKSINLEKIKEIVEKNEKKRFVLVTEAGGRYKIKACQGHSFEVVFKFRISKLKSV